MALFRLILPAVALLAAAPFGIPGARAQTPEGISTPVLSRCAGRVGIDTRAADSAFGAIALDGMPWMQIEHGEDTVGQQPIWGTIASTGSMRRRDGTAVPIRFTCMLDAQGQALSFHAAHLMPTLGDALPPATIVTGTVSHRERSALPRGVELRLQLLDLEAPPGQEVVAEQVIRSGRPPPIPFALRIPKATPLANRKLVLAARMVLARQVLFQLAEPRPVTADALHKPIELVLEKPATAGR